MNVIVWIRPMVSAGRDRDRILGKTTRSSVFLHTEKFIFLFSLPKKFSVQVCTCHVIDGPNLKETSSFWNNLYLCPLAIEFVLWGDAKQAENLAPSCFSTWRAWTHVRTSRILQIVEQNNSAFKLLSCY